MDKSFIDEQAHEKALFSFRLEKSHHIRHFPFHKTA
jgi:hypothetical protein